MLPWNATVNASIYYLLPIFYLSSHHMISSQYIYTGSLLHPFIIFDHLLWNISRILATTFHELFGETWCVISCLSQRGDVNERSGLRGYDNHLIVIGIIVINNYHFGSGLGGDNNHVIIVIIIDHYHFATSRWRGWGGGGGGGWRSLMTLVPVVILLWESEKRWQPGHKRSQTMASRRWWWWWGGWCVSLIRLSLFFSLFTICSTTPTTTPVISPFTFGCCSWPSRRRVRA